jgi:hypothetical protein
MIASKGISMFAIARQRGMTVISVLIILIMIAFVGLIVMRILPIYIDYFSIRSSLEGLKKEPEIERMTLLDVQQRIQKRFDISYVNIIDARRIKVRQQGRDKVLELAYEDRRPLLGNLDVIAKFNETITLPASQ